ncbi:hypothetical protein BC835DRAFT_1412197 [Cytidiella melzeri]|nr:hypothetical protein BC835DRAFT_1412197 [Cytidiella melzeri]
MLPPGLSTRLPTKHALRLVKKVIERQPSPVKTQDLYKQVLKESSVQTASGETLDHGVWSMRYLKSVLLRTLANQKVVEQIHVKPTIKADEKVQTLSKMSKAQRQSTTVKTALHGYFAWQVRKAHPTPKLKLLPKPFGTVVGVGEDWGHLNKRRQRRRDEKVQKDVEWLKEVEAARREAVSL